MNRLHIFSFYDPTGIVDRYVEFMLRAFAEHCSRLVVVCSGKLTPKGRRTLTAITPDVIVRENKGFDACAYRIGLDYVGWRELSEYDELVMSNDTIAGPVYPLAEMYRTMDARDMDYWGLTSDPEKPEHIRTHFIAVRKQMLCSYEFRRYWEGVPEISTREQAIEQEETFTKSFSEFGFRHDTYIKCDAEMSDCGDPLLWAGKKLMETRRCPFCKRETFFYTPYDDVIHHSAGCGARELLDYLRDQTDYDTDMILEHAIRTANMRDIKSCVRLSHILPVTAHDRKDDAFLRCRAICYLPTEDATLVHEASAAEVVQKLSAVLNDVLVFSDNRSVQLPNARAFESSGAPRGLLDSFGVICDHSAESDLIAVVRLDKKTTGGASAEYSAAQTFLQCVAPNREYVQQISALFRENRYLGMLMPPPMMAHAAASGCHDEDTSCHQDLKALADLLGVPFDGRSPVSPYDGIYWCRSSVLQEIRQLILDRWEEMADLRHLFEREYSFSCALGILIQALGYYSGWVMSAPAAEQLLEKYDYQLRKQF